MPESYNPNHPMVRATNDSWHKIVALLMQKQGLTEVIISGRDVANLAKRALCIVVSEDQRGIVLSLVSDAEGQKLAAKHGGTVEQN